MSRISIERDSSQSDKHMQIAKTHARLVPSERSFYDVACWVKLNLKYYREHELQNFINLKCLKGIPPCYVHVHVGKRRLCPNMTELSVRVRSRYRTLPIQMLQIRSSESICRIGNNPYLYLRKLPTHTVNNFL